MHPVAVFGMFCGLYACISCCFYLIVLTDWNLEWGVVDRRRKEKRPDRTANPQNSTRLGTPEGLVPVVYQEWGVVEGAPTAA